MRLPEPNDHEVEQFCRLCQVQYMLNRTEVEAKARYTAVVQLAYLMTISNADLDKYTFSGVKEHFRLQHKKGGP